ncbi:MAG: hypothetical protein IKC70_05420 [Bacteroidaceae bacterium]|nr:hypothetical protein [Bacteroidaceae bacterium]
MKEKKGKISNPFTLPDNYFEEFHRNLMQQLPQKEIATQPRIKQLPTNKIRRWSYAAAIVLMLTMGITALYQHESNETTITEAENNEIIETIFDSYTIDDYNVYCYLTNSDINF